MYNIGQGTLSVVPSFKGVAEAIDAEASKWGDSAGSVFGDSFAAAARSGTSDAVSGDATQAAEKGDTAGGAFGEAFRQRVEAALRALPDANVGLDATEFDAELLDIRAELETLRNQKIGIDISDTDALAKLAELKLALTEIGRSSQSIDVKVNTTSAIKDITALESQVSGAFSALSGSGAGVGVGGIGTLGTDAASASFSIGDLLVPALVALATALIPIAGLAAGALTAIPAIVSGAGLGLGALVLGFSGVIGAVTAYRATLNTAGDTAAQVKTKQDALVNAMAGLTPAGQTFVAFVASQLLPIFDQMKNAAQTALLPGITAGLQAMLPFFQGLQPFIVQAAQGIGDLFSKFGAFIGSAKGMSEINAIFSSGAGLMQQLGKAALILFEAFTSIGSKAGPIVKAIGDGIVNLVKAFAKWAEGKGFEDFLRWVQTNGPSIVRDISNVVGAFVKVTIALEPIGKAVLDLVGAFAKVIEIIAPVIAAIARFIGWINETTQPLILLVNHWHQAWSDIEQWATVAYEHIKSAVFDPLVNFFTQTIPQTFDIVVGFFTALPGRLRAAVGDIVGTVFGALLTAGTWIYNNVITPVIGFFTRMPGTIASDLSNFVSDIFADIGDVAAWIDKHIVQPIVDAIKSIPSKIGHLGGQILGDITSGIGGAASSVLGAIGLAAGGIVTKPTLAMVAEAGHPEAVIPLDDPQRALQILGLPFTTSVQASLPETSNALLAAPNNLSPATSSTGGPLFDRSVMHFHNEAEIQGLMRQASFFRRARRL